MFKKTNPVDYAGDIEGLIDELQKELPSGASAVTIIICAKSFKKAEAGRIRDLPVRFVQPSPENIVGTVWLEYWMDEGGEVSAAETAVGSCRNVDL